MYWPRILAIYPIVLLTRGLAIVAFFPLLRRWGTSATWKDAVVMWWGGLRGSVGLALALAIQHTVYDKNMWGEASHVKLDLFGRNQISLDCRDQPLVVVAITVVVVFTTVVINGVTMAPIMRYLKMTEASASRKMMLNGSYSKLRGETKECVHHLQGEMTFFKFVDWDAVQKGSDAIDLDTKDFELGKDEDEVKILVPKAAWLSVLSIERSSYLHQFEQGHLSTEGFAALEAFMATLTADAASIETAEKPTDDDIKKLYKDLETLYKDKVGELCKKLCKHDKKAEKGEEKAADKHKLKPRLSRMRFFDRVLAYHVAKAFMIGQLEVKHKMMLFHKSSNKTQVAAKDAMVKVASQHEDIINMMNEVLKAADNEEPEGKDQEKFKEWKSRYAAELLLLEQRECVEHLQHEGLLDSLDAAPLLQNLDNRIGYIMRAPLVEWGRGMVRKIKRVPERLAHGNLIVRSASGHLDLAEDTELPNRADVPESSPTSLPFIGEHSAAGPTAESRTTSIRRSRWVARVRP